MDKTKLTTVKVLDGCYRKFKIQSITNDFTLQKLVNRTLHKFVHDAQFREELLSQSIPDADDSKF